MVKSSDIMVCVHTNLHGWPGQEAYTCAAGTTIDELFRLVCGDDDVADYSIHVNRTPVATGHVLKTGDRIGILKVPRACNKCHPYAALVPRKRFKAGQIVVLRKNTTVQGSVKETGQAGVQVNWDKPRGRWHQTTTWELPDALLLVKK